jgi:adenylate cyclase
METADRRMSEAAARAPTPGRLGRVLQHPSWRNAQTWRLASGLVLFTFVLTHFLNHALGHVSLEAMEDVQAVRRALWRSWPGTILLYGAAAVHVGLALGKLVNRRTWRMPPWEALQIALGLTIPFLLVRHVAATRGLNSVYGLDDLYRTELRVLWPGLAERQTLLILVVWLHATIGLHHWLKTKTWYARWRPLLLGFAVLVPALAITGWIEAGRRVALMQFSQPPLSEVQAAGGGELIERAETAVWVLFGAAFLALVLVRFAAWIRRGPIITYPGGRRVRAASGATLLEVSRAAGVPHASVCGGRGRCTTCRVLVSEGADTLPPPNTTESAALTRIHAPPGVRLACQVRPAHSLAVRPLIPLREAQPTLGRDAQRWGVERRITVMFADLRSFTTLAERLYPYDAVFLLNRFFELMSQAIERHGGAVDKFLGDGVMALFGVVPARGAGSRDALFAARDMLRALDRLNEEFEATLAGQLRMGLGIHMGPAVLGRVGGRNAGLTALGDSVNIASRLESLNKEFGSVLVISDAALHASGLVLEGAETHQVAVRGRGEMLTVHVVKTLEAITDISRPVSAA